MFFAPFFADLIDASSWSPSLTNAAAGDGTSSGYTAVSWANTANGSADDGLAVTPNGGDTTKKLFFPHAGRRYISGSTGSAGNYGSEGWYLSADQYPSNTSTAWRLYFYSGTSSGGIGNGTKLEAISLRCVRS